MTWVLTDGTDDVSRNEYSVCWYTAADTGKCDCVLVVSSMTFPSSWTLSAPVLFSFQGIQFSFPFKEYPRPRSIPHQNDLSISRSCLYKVFLGCFHSFRNKASVPSLTMQRSLYRNVLVSTPLSPRFSHSPINKVSQSPINKVVTITAVQSVTHQQGRNDNCYSASHPSTRS